ncbi:MAG: hypothetical protein ABR500_04555 [Dermatophilaceae bacterium]|nr:hypothetical protein [Intrasporangiaceae bacterium]
MTTSSAEPCITLLVVPDCPNEKVAAESLREALALEGLQGVPFATIVVEDEDLADRLGFTGSPSVHVDGRDLFPTDGPPSMVCRLYPGHGGRLRGAPTVLDLRAALRTAFRSGRDGTVDGGGATT